MSEHWCEVHQTDYFKTPKMKTYAHPVKDAAGKTLGWCNEPETPSAAPAQQATQQPQPEPAERTEWAPHPVKQASIEAQSARANLMNLVIAELGIPEEDRLIKDDIARALVSQLYSYTSLSFNGSYKEKGGHVVEAAKKAGAIEVDRTHGQFANVGAFLNRCHQEYGLQRPQVETILGEPITAKMDLDTAWLTVTNTETK